MTVSRKPKLVVYMSQATLNELKMRARRKKLSASAMGLDYIEMGLDFDFQNERYEVDASFDPRSNQR